MRMNIKRSWWRGAEQRNDLFGLDGAIMTSLKCGSHGHVATFHDPLTECKTCHHRFRADHQATTVCQIVWRTDSG